MQRRDDPLRRALRDLTPRVALHRLHTTAKRVRELRIASRAPRAESLFKGWRGPDSERHAGHHCALVADATIRLVSDDAQPTRVATGDSGSLRSRDSADPDALGKNSCTQSRVIERRAAAVILDSFKRAASSAAPSRRLRRHDRHPLIGPSCGRGPTTCEGIGTIFAGVASSAQSNPSSVPFGLQIRS